jgi:sugar-specific transcriptional regulator TrmB
MIEDKLKELGLSDKESAVYTALVEAGKASPARLAKATGIKRPTVYAVGEDLLLKGLIEADTTGPTMFYYPASAEALTRSVEKERRALEAKKHLLESLAHEVEALPRSKTYAVPKIRFIEHQENIVEFLDAQAPLWNKSLLATEPVWWGFQDNSFVEQDAYRDWIKRYWQGAPEAVELNVLSNRSETEERVQKESVARRRIKYWAGTEKFSAAQWIIGEYSVMIQTKQKPHYLVQLHDPLYCQNMRELFKNLWAEIGS